MAKTTTKVTTIQKAITIRKDQEIWLSEQPGINLSGLTQKALDDLRKKMEG